MRAIFYYISQPSPYFLVYFGAISTTGERAKSLHDKVPDPVEL
ncbi:MAG: hypothetical protein WBW03_00245 [Silvibacterium sp.]|jgi:hypothetical protein